MAGCKGNCNVDDTDSAYSQQETTTYYDLIVDPQSRKLLLSKYLIKSYKMQRGLPFTMGSLLSWCSNAKGHSFNPTVDQVAQRAGFSSRHVKEHIAILWGDGLIERMETRKSTRTTIREIARNMYQQAGYLEIPVAIVQEMSQANVPTLARLVMATMTNRINLAERLVANHEWVTVEPEEQNLSAIASLLGVRKYRVSEAVNTLEYYGFPVEVTDDSAYLLTGTEITYEHTHDTRCNF